MAKRGTLGSRADNARKQGQRRIKQLDKIISDSNTTQRLREWANNTKREITCAMQGTRRYSKTGKRYKSKTDKYIESQISRLQSAIEKVIPNLSTKSTLKEERINAFTQSQINKAKIKGVPSIYTAAEVSVFYRATQNIWQKEGVALEERNEVILREINERRLMKGLSRVTLRDVMEHIVQSNFFAIHSMEVTDSRRKTDPRLQQMQEDLMAKQAKNDNEGSPTATIAEASLDALMDSLSNLVNLVNPEDI